MAQFELPNNAIQDHEKDTGGYLNKLAETNADVPLGWRELVEAGAIEANNPRARDVIARWLFDLIRAGETDREKLKAQVIARFSCRT
jgi:hypothetical protein